MTRETREYDAIIVGTGMGGGAAGFRLAQAGQKVLFLERGVGQVDTPSGEETTYPEALAGPFAEGRAAVMAAAGRSTYRVNGWPPVLGSGLGGSSAVYGACLLRYHRADFAHWPFAYDDLASFYSECERALGARGATDPLGEPSPALRTKQEMSLSQREIFDFLTGAGLHPFRAPIGYDAVEGCSNCFGFRCARNCKKHSGNVFVTPALHEHGAELRENTRVEYLEFDGRRCSAVHCIREGKTETFRAKAVFLAAGGLMTPVLLFKTAAAGATFLTGLPIGRYLTRHFVDFYYVRTESRDGHDSKLVDVSCSDFYAPERGKFGILNSVGGLMEPHLMASEYAARIVGGSAAGRFAYPLLNGIVGLALRRATRDRLLVVSLMPDAALPENRVLPLSTVSDVRITYSIGPEDRRKIAEFRRTVLKLLKPLGVNLVKLAEDNSFLAYAASTCRMGEDPATSVTDRHGRIHGSENVFVVDSAVLPESGAANPALTIAACASKLAQEYLTGV